MLHPRERELLPFARELRKNMTREECRLWYEFLRDYPLRFRRQEIIGGYIADFYCSSVKMIVELDGSQHYEDDGKEYDQRRTEFFEECGIAVVRFSNTDIRKNFSGVCEKIDLCVKERQTPQSAKADSSPCRGAKEMT